jgi:hypothetical protein
MDDYWTLQKGTRKVSQRITTHFKTGQPMTDESEFQQKLE